MFLQRCIENLVKHLRWSVLQLVFFCGRVHLVKFQAKNILNHLLFLYHKLYHTKFFRVSFIVSSSLRVLLLWLSPLFIVHFTWPLLIRFVIFLFLEAKVDAKTIPQKWYSRTFLLVKARICFFTSSFFCSIPSPLTCDLEVGNPLERSNR